MCLVINLFQCFISLNKLKFTWPGPKPAKRPSECFGFLGLLVGPAAGGPDIEDCLEIT